MKNHACVLNACLMHWFEEMSYFVNFEDDTTCVQITRAVIVVIYRFKQTHRQ